MKRILSLFAVLAMAAAVQAQTTRSEATDAAFQQATLVNGVTQLLNAGIFDAQARLEITTTGAPTSARLVVSGCMTLGTCEFLGIWDSPVSGVLYLPGQYDKYKLVPTLAGGASPTFAVYLEAIGNESWATQAAYSPTQLNMNAVVLPSSGTTSQSSIVSLVNVRAMSILYNCGQAVKLNVINMAEDGTTSLRTDILTTGSTASVWAEYQLTPGQKNVINDTAGAVQLTLPHEAAAFSLTNSTASASTCTMRIITQY